MSPHELVRVLDGLGRPRIMLLGDRPPDGSPGLCAVSLLRGLSADVTCAGTSTCRKNSTAEETRRIERIESLMPWHDALVIRDHCRPYTPGVLRAAIRAAALVQLPTIVHPSDSRPLEDYRGATAITVDRGQAARATGLSIANPLDARAAGQQLCGLLEAPMVFLALDRGIMLVEQSGYGEFFPARARAHDHVHDAEVSLAVIALCLAEGTTPDDAARLACVAAQLEGELLTRAALRAKLLALQPAVLPIPKPPVRRAG